MKNDNCVTNRSTRPYDTDAYLARPFVSFRVPFYSFHFQIDALVSCLLKFLCCPAASRAADTQETKAQWRK